MKNNNHISARAETFTLLFSQNFHGTYLNCALITNLAFCFAAHDSAQVQQLGVTAPRLVKLVQQPQNFFLCNNIPSVIAGYVLQEEGNRQINSTLNESCLWFGAIAAENYTPVHFKSFQESQATQIGPR